MLRRPIFYVPILVIIMFCSTLQATGPDGSSMIMVTRDWMRRDKLTFDSNDLDFERETKDTLEFAKKTLAYVEKSADRSKLKIKLKNLEENVNAGANWRKLYIDICKLRREIIFSHPALDFEKILINVNPPTKYSHNGDQHLGRHSRIGPGLTILTDWKTENPKATAILKDKLPEGATRNPDLHYDADKVVFSFCDHTAEGQKRYFLYEAAIDGSWVKQLTGTKRDKFETWDDRATVIIEDNDGCYLPDGNIIFISTRSQTFGRCHGARYNPAWVLYRCDGNGDNIRQLSYNNENEYEPSVLNDGRIVFTRWEYTNRHEMLFHMLWWCRPDGTGASNFYGADTLHPMMVVEARAIPGTHKIVATAMAHHSYNTGTTVVLDTNLGDNDEEPVTHVTPETPYPESHGWPEPHYSHPYPVNEELFLVSRANHPVHKQGQTPPPADRGIYLIDPVGGRELIYENPNVASFSPIPIRKRQRPPVLPSVLPDGAPDYGTVYVQNAYLTGNDPEGKIQPGSIKAIRVNALGVKPQGIQAQCNAASTNDVPKKVLGTVPVDENGSAYFKIPARTSVQLQILDKNGMAILTEKSFFYLQPGENRGCIGCHEPSGTSPDRAAMSRIARMKPADLAPPAGPRYPGGMSYRRTVQPVMDRYCIQCHGLEKNDNGINLVDDGSIDIGQTHPGTYPGVYSALLAQGEHRIGRRAFMGGHPWDGVPVTMGSVEYNISRPYRFYAHGNKVSHMLANGDENHPKLIDVDRESYMRVIEWLDLNGQFYGDLFPNKHKIAQRGIDPIALSELRAFVRELFGEELARQPDRALVNPAQPEESRILMAPLAAEAGGWGQINGFTSKQDPKFKKLLELVDQCIVRHPNENVHGWQPLLECGGGVPWVIKARKNHLANTSSGIAQEKLVVLSEHQGPVIGPDHPDVKASGNRSGFETGQLVKHKGVYHMFVNEMFGQHHIDMRVSHWSSSDAVNWKRQSTVVDRVPGRSHKNHRSEVWLTGVKYNDVEEAWNIFFVSYRGGNSKAGEIFGCDYEGNIWRGRSTVKGPDGIAGPYKDVEIILQPDQNSQKWEGQQAVDSFNPYKAGDKWYGFYGGHYHKPRGPWPVGLAVADKLSGPWKRMPEGFNPVPIVKTFIENPIVTQLPDGRYLAIFDSLGPREIGYSISKDGTTWPLETRLTAQTGDNSWAGTGDHDMRTALCAIREDDGTFTVIYTAKMKDKGFWAVGKCTLGWTDSKK